MMWGMVLDHSLCFDIVRFLSVSVGHLQRPAATESSLLAGSTSLPSFSYSRLKRLRLFYCFHHVKAVKADWGGMLVVGICACLMRLRHELADHRVGPTEDFEMGRP